MEPLSPSASSSSIIIWPLAVFALTGLATPSSSEETTFMFLVASGLRLRPTICDHQTAQESSKDAKQILCQF